MDYIRELRALMGHRLVNLCGSVVVIEEGAGRILMQQRRFPHGKWGLPGGLMELGESFEEAARREALEETGLRLATLRLLGVYSGKSYLCTGETGDRWYTAMAAFVCADFEGTARVSDDESLCLAWLDPRALPEDVAGTHRRVLADYLAGR